MPRQPENHGEAPQSHHHLRGHGRDPHAFDVAASADHAGGDRRRGDRRGGSRRGGRPSPCPRPRRRPARPATRRPSRRFCKVIKQRSNCVINITTGGAPTMAIEERLRPAPHFKPEVASLNMGSMNFGLYPMLDPLQGLQVRLGAALPRRLARPHLQEHLRGHRAHPHHLRRERHPLRDRVLRHRPPLHAGAFRRARLVKPPFFVQSVFGILGGIGPHPEDVAHMKRTADRLFGDQYHWSVLGAGRNQLPIAAMAAAMGGNVRVGLEDSLWIGAGKLAEVQRRSRSRRRARSSRASASTSPRPTRRARSSSSRAATG